jgi:hypothetical protein
MVARRFGAMRFSNWTAAWVAFGLGLRLFHYLRDPSVWHDEAFLILNVLGKGFRELLGPLFFAEAAPPLFLWIERAVTLILGDSTYALRLVPFLASCASLVLMVPVARRVLHAKVVPWAIMLMACSEHLLWHACEAKPYALDVLAATATIAAFCFTDSWSLVSRLLLFAALAPCLIFLDYPGCFLCGGVLVALLLAVWRSRQMQAWMAYGLFGWVVLGCFLILLAGPVHAQRCPAMVQCWENSFPDWQRPASVPLWSLLQTLEVFRYCFEPLGQVYLGLAVLGGVCLWRRGGRPQTLLFVSPLLLALAASYLHAYPYCGARILVYMTPGLTLLIAEGIAAALAWFHSLQSSRFGPALTLARLGPVVVVVLLLLPAARSVQRAIFPWPRADCAAAAAYVRARLGPGEQVAANHVEYAYYFRDLGSNFTLLDQSPRVLPQRFWLITTTPDRATRLALVSSLGPGDWRILEQDDFLWTSVFLLSREAPSPSPPIRAGSVSEGPVANASGSYGERR